MDLNNNIYNIKRFKMISFKKHEWSFCVGLLPLMTWTWTETQSHSVIVTLPGQACLLYTKQGRLACCTPTLGGLTDSKQGTRIDYKVAKPAAWMVHLFILAQSRADPDLFKFNLAPILLNA